MALEGDGLVSPTAEVPVIEGDVVSAIRTLAARGIGKKTIAREVGVAVNTVRRYLRGAPPGVQTRPGARRMTDAQREAARTFYAGEAAGNAVVVHRLLAAQDCAVTVRTIERVVADLRQATRAAALATVRVETPPGEHYGEPDVMVSPGGDRGRPAGLAA
jgi:hypothetical protein